MGKWSQGRDNTLVVLQRSLIFVLAIISFSLFSYSGVSWFLADTIGSDYTSFVPKLLYGYYWFNENGFWEIPWFSPAWCAGLPYFANPQVMYYSLPQWFVLFVNPQVSILITFILFGLVGAISMYALLRVSFRLSGWMSLLGASLFLFNEFFLSRMLVGHLTYHMFPLIPLIAFLTIQASKPDVPLRQRLMLTVGNAYLIAYFVHGGASNFVVPAMVSVAGLLILYALWKPLVLPGLTKWFLLSGAVGFLLSFQKIVASYSFIRWFHRESLDLGLFDSLQISVFSSFTMLFMNPWIVLLEQQGQYLIQDHELRFGVTFVPLLLVLIGMVQIIRLTKSSTITRVLLMALLIVCMGIPVVLSVHSPEWHHFLKSIPYLKDTSLALRWLALDIPIIIVGACVVANRSLGPTLGMTVSVAGILIILVSHISFHRPEDARYDPGIIVAAYNAVKAGEPIKPISQVLLRDRSKRFLNNGDKMTEGRTTDTCYEPIFGYRLENYPKKQITSGSVFAQANGYLNLKNPACYVFPEENACQPGDHFMVEEIASARLFASYQPFNFNQSLVQKIANWVSLLTLIITSMSLGLLAVFRKHQ